MIITRFFLFCFLSFTLLSQAWAESSSVWKVSKDGKHLFIGGTIHMLSQDDYPLPSVFDTAYQQASVVVLETDAKAMQEPAFQQRMMMAMMYRDGRNLQQVLKPKTFAALSEHMQSRGLPLDQMLLLKPGMVSMTLSVIELQRLGQTATGVDSYFSNRASQDGKQLGKLETVEQQLTFLADMGKGREDDMILYTLRDLEDLPTILSDMKSAWRKGDMASLEKTSLTEMRDTFPAIYKSLLLDRNNDWMPKIEGYIRSAQVEFILVGSLHLAGDEGVLEQLKARGYQVEQL